MDLIKLNCHDMALNHGLLSGYLRFQTYLAKNQKNISLEMECLLFLIIGFLMSSSLTHPVEELLDGKAVSLPLKSAEKDLQDITIPINHRMSRQVENFLEDKDSKDDINLILDNKKPEITALRAANVYIPTQPPMPFDEEEEDDYDDHDDYDYDDDAAFSRYQYQKPKGSSNQLSGSNYNHPQRNRGIKQKQLYKYGKQSSPGQPKKDMESYSVVCYPDTGDYSQTMKEQPIPPYCINNPSPPPICEQFASIPLYCVDMYSHPNERPAVFVRVLISVSCDELADPPYDC